MDEQQQGNQPAHDAEPFAVRRSPYAHLGDRARVGSYRPGSLPPQVRRALDLLCAGCTYTEIARAMGVSAWTVKTMLRQAYRSLGVRHKGEAVAVWLRSATING